MHASTTCSVTSHVTPITIGNIFRRPDYKSKLKSRITFKLENENVNKHSSRSKNRFHLSERGCKLSKMQAGHTYFARDAPEIAIHSLFDKNDVEKKRKTWQSRTEGIIRRWLGFKPRTILHLCADVRSSRRTQCHLRGVFQLVAKWRTVWKYQRQVEVWKTVSCGGNIQDLRLRQ